MSRIGYEKVRTGCLTCKKRKVKCDESKPTCLKCRKSGKECAGYITAPVGSISWSRLLSSGHSRSEERSLDLFRDVVGPALLGPVASSSWTATMFQLSRQENGPARDAILSISLLFESSSSSNAAVPGSPSPPERQERAAVLYYNRALRHVATEQLDARMVLCLSVMFITIELLRYNPRAAFEHCRHALHILQGSDTNGDIFKIVLAIFRHLSVFPSFIGTTLSDYHLVPENETITYHGFKHIFEASEAMDSLMSRSARLVREFDLFRQGPLATSMPTASLLTSWHYLRQDLNAWYSGLSAVGRQPKVLVVAEEQSLYRILELRWLLCDIWVDKVLFPEETRYDAYRGHFERIRDLAKEEADTIVLCGSSDESSLPAEKGLAPILHFAALKCRYLRLRLEILVLLQKMVSNGEAMWDSATMEAVGRRIIEVEHGMETNSEQSIDSLLESCLMEDPVVPSEEQRVENFYLEDDTHMSPLPSGPKMQRRPVHFVFGRSNQGPRIKVKDWIILPA
ncbi:C6 zinc finger domain-containing protein [Apiospora arundinis]